jgi:hypothetical protein
MTKNEQYELPSGETVQNNLTNVFDYHAGSENSRSLYDLIFDNSCLLLASKIYAPTMNPETSVMLRQDGSMGSLLCIMVEQFGKYRLKDELNYFITIHPQMTVDGMPVFKLQLIELTPETIEVTEENKRSTIHIGFESVDDIIQTHFKKHYNAVLKDIEAGFGKHRADTTKMLNSSDYKTSLKAFTCNQDLFIPLFIPAIKKG